MEHGDRHNEYHDGYYGDKHRNKHDDCRNEHDDGCPTSRSKRQTPAALVGAAGGEAQRAAQGTELVRFAQHTHASLPRSLWATKHSSTLCHAQGATASRVARGFKRKRGSARALFDLGSATAQRADGGRPPRLRSLLAAIGAPPERCCNRHATLTGRPFSRLHLSPSLTLRRLLRCAKPSARRPIAIAARKKAGLGARCSRGEPRPFFGRARVSFLACLLVNKYAVVVL